MSKEYDCSCWRHYPNEHHKHKNGKWKCVDDYECIRDLVDERATTSGYNCCTHCRKKDTRIWIKIELGRKHQDQKDKY